MSNPSSPTQIMTNDEFKPTSPIVTSSKSPGFMAVTAEEIRPSESEPSKEEYEEESEEETESSDVNYEPSEEEFEPFEEEFELPNKELRTPTTVTEPIPKRARRRRSVEELYYTTEVGESSAIKSISPPTQEPVQPTNSVLMMRLELHEDKLCRLENNSYESLSKEVEQLRHKTSEVKEDLSSIKQINSSMHDDIVGTREEFYYLIRRVEHSEQRTGEADRKVIESDQRVRELEQRIKESEQHRIEAEQ